MRVSRHGEARQDQGEGDQRNDTPARKQGSRCGKG